MRIQIEFYQSDLKPPNSLTYVCRVFISLSNFVCDVDLHTAHQAVHLDHCQLYVESQASFNGCLFCRAAFFSTNKYLLPFKAFDIITLNHAKIIITLLGASPQFHQSFCLDRYCGILQTAASQFLFVKKITRPRNVNKIYKIDTKFCNLLSTSLRYRFRSYFLLCHRDTND